MIFCPPTAPPPAAAAGNCQGCAAASRPSPFSTTPPEFTLCLTATPERAGNKNILDIFKNAAHKLDIQTVAEIGGSALVRCIRTYIERICEEKLKQ